MTNVSGVKLTLIPGRSIGPFVFGQELTPESAELLEKIGTDSGKGWEWTEFKLRGDESDSVRVYLEDNLITSVSCYSECLVSEVNLIGKTIEEAEAVLGVHATSREHQDVLEEKQVVHEYDAEGLLLWTLDGIIVTAQCSAS